MSEVDTTKTPMRIRRFVLLLIVPICLVIAVDAESQIVPPVPRVPSLQPPMSIVTDETSGITITLRSMRRGGTLLPQLARHQRIDHQTGLPELLFTLAVPHGATSISADVSLSGEDTLVAAGSVGNNSAARSPVEVTEGGTLRGYRLVLLRFRFARRMGAFVAMAHGATIRVRWTYTGGVLRSGATRESPAVREILRGTIDNYDRVSGWRPTSVGSRRLAGIGGWGMEAESVVLLAPGDGVTAVSGADLSSASRGMMTSPRIADLRLRTRSTSVAFDAIDHGGDGFLDASDTILFGSRRNPPEESTQYFDAATDTNAYILSVLGTGGTASLVRVDGSASAAELGSFDAVLHLERDSVYYPGNSYADSRSDITTIFVPERVPGEGFYWTRIVYPGQERVTFSCAPHYWNYGTTDVRLAFTSASDTAHYFNVRLNGIDVGKYGFHGFGDTTISINVPCHYLLNGLNEIYIVPAPPPWVQDPADWNASDQYHLDFIELAGKWQASSFGGAAKVTLPTDGARRMTMSGALAPPREAISVATRAPIDSAQKGWLFRVSVRQFDVPLRSKPGFVAQWDRGTFESVSEGIMMAEVDGATGTKVREGRFPTFVDPTAFDDATQFVRDVRTGNVLIAGFSIGAGTDDVTPGFRAAIEELGSRRLAVGGLFQYSWAFVARKGDLSSVAEVSERMGMNNRGLSLNAFVPDSLNGTVWQGKTTLTGRAGEVFQVDARSSPRARFHAADSLLAETNAADLVIVTHPAFRRDAERLAEHRRNHDSLRVRVVDVNLIYDEFNDGVKSPTAIRRFLHYADSNWTDPAPFFVVLFGDGTSDPQRRVATTIGVDYIPTYGQPAADYMFTVAPGDSTMRYRQLIGRLPANTPEQASWLVDKLIAYDDYRPSTWNSRFVFMAGGNSARELAMHREEDSRLAEEYVLTPLFRGDTAMVFRTTADLSFPDANDGPWARQELSKGTLFASFAGHGASKVYDLDFGYPRQLSNSDRLFVLGSFSCRTGAFDDPDAPGRNEEWLVYPQTGAVAAIGGTSYSSPEIDAAFKAYLYGAITLERRRLLGDVFTLSKYNGMFAGLEHGWQYSIDGIARRNSLCMYSLLGDPSMKLALRNTVELAIGDISLRSEDGGEPSPADSVVVVHAVVRSHGRLLSNADSSVVVVASITDKGGRRFYDTVAFAEQGRELLTLFRLPLSRGPGEYTVHVEIDPGQRIGEETYRDDNDTIIPLRVRGNQVLALEPLPYGVVSSYDSLTIRLLNPPSGGGAVILVDTSSAFDPASRFSSADVGTTTTGELTTTWTASIPQRLRSASRFWWHAVSTSGDTVVARIFPYISTFTVAPSPGKTFEVGGVHQFAEGKIVGLRNAEDGVGPGYRDVPIEVMSIGQAGFTGKRIAAIIDGDDYFTISYDGLNVLVLPAGDDRPSAYGKFAFFRQVQSGGDDIDRFLEMIDTVEPGERVVVVASGPSFFWTDSAAAVIARLKSLGASAMVDSLIDRFDSYALIGGKGLAPEQIVEARNNADLDTVGSVIHPAYARSTLRVVAREGSYTSPVAGPARRWDLLRIDGANIENCRAAVVGLRRDGGRDTLLATIGSTALDLRSIDPTRYPWLEGLIRFPADTMIRVRSIGITYDPTPELAIVPSTASFGPDSVLQGDASRFRATIANLTRTGATAVEDGRFLLRSSLGTHLVDSVTIPSVPPLDSVTVSIPVQTDAYTNQTTFRLEINADQSPVEPYWNTNAIDRDLRVTVDRSRPSVVVYADGERLMPGDYVRPGAEFEARLFDNSALELDSSTTITKVILDLDFIYATTPGARWSVVNNGNHRASFYYKPLTPLGDGAHEMRVYAADASGNGDTTDFIAFNVESKMRLRNVVNWPNPFARSTTFTFMVSGESSPADGEIAVFTVSGRRIRTIPLSSADLSVGFNAVEWDGLDADGDRLANGVYLYRVRVSDGSTTLETIEKLAVVR